MGDPPQEKAVGELTQQVRVDRQAIGLARQLREELKSNTPRWDAHGAEFSAWRDRVVALVRRLYGNGSPQLSEFFARSSFSLGSYTLDEEDNRRRLEENFVWMLPRAAGWLDALVEDLEARLPSSADIPRRYLWSSPVFWAEKLADWLHLERAWSWAKHHRVFSLVVTGVFLLAALLQILNLLNVLKRS